MDLTNSIAATSIANSAQRVGDSVTIATLNKALDIQVDNAAAMLSALPQPPQPEGSLGHNLDVRA